MACSCQRSTGVVSNIPELVRDKLKNILLLYPTTKYACILTTNGDLISSLVIEETLSSDSLSKIAALKRSAIHFASTLNQNDCPVIQVTGETHMFSCYEVGEFLLAFYTDIESGTFGTLDIAESSDQKMIDIVEDLKLMLQNVLIVNSNNGNSKI